MKRGVTMKREEYTDAFGDLLTEDVGIVNKYLKSERIIFANYPDVMNIKDVQSALSVSRSTAYKLISTGAIKHWKIGKNIKIPKAFLIDFIVESCYNGTVVEKLAVRESEVENNDGESNGEPI